MPVKIATSGGGAADADTAAKTDSTRGRSIHRRPNSRSDRQLTQLPEFFTPAQLRKIANDYDQHERHKQRKEHQLKQQQQRQQRLQEQQQQEKKQQMREQKQVQQKQKQVQPEPNRLRQEQQQVQQEQMQKHPDQQQHEQQKVQHYQPKQHQQQMPQEPQQQQQQPREQVQLQPPPALSYGIDRIFDIAGAAAANVYYDDDDDDELFECNAFLENLHYAITAEQIVAHLGGQRAAGIVRVQISRTKQRYSMGGLCTRTALVEFDHLASRDRALLSSGTMLRGRRVTVQAERPSSWSMLDKHEWRLAQTL